MSAFDLLATTGVFRTLDDLSEEDYDLVAETMLQLAVTPIPAQAKKLRTRRATVLLGEALGVIARDLQGSRPPAPDRPTAALLCNRRGAGGRR